MQGPTAAKEMRKLGSDVVIIGLTGNLFPDDVEHFKECGANAVLSKPFIYSSFEEILIHEVGWFRSTEL